MSTTPVSTTVQTSELRAGDMVHGGHKYTSGDWATVTEVIPGHSETTGAPLIWVSYEQRSQDGPRRRSVIAEPSAEWVRLTF